MGTGTEIHDGTEQRGRGFGTFNLKWDIFTTPLLLSIGDECGKRGKKEPEIVGSSQAATSCRYNRHHILVNSQRL